MEVTAGTLSKGGLWLLARQVVVQAISFICTIILTRVLDVADFGIYAIVGFFVGFLSLIGSGGIASGLIQMDSDPSRRQLGSAFTLLQLLYGGSALLGIPISFLLVRVYASLGSYLTMVWVSLLTYYLGSFRTLPAIRLERSLGYGKLAILETIETSSFQISSVIFALLGYGVWSFVLAALISRVLGLGIVYFLSPTSLVLSFDFRGVGRLVRFGLSLQLNAVMSFLRDALVPTFIGLSLGPVAVGLVNFSTRVGSYPMLPLGVVNRMAFPVLSRLQKDDSKFSDFVSGLVKLYIGVLAFGVSAMITLLHPTIDIVYSAKWNPAMILVAAQLFVNIAGAFAWPLMSALQARGTVRDWLYFEIVQFVMTWIFGVPLVHFFGLKGWALTTILTQAPVAILIARARAHLKTRYWAAIRPALVASAVSIGFILLLETVIRRYGWSQLVASYLCGLAGYILAYLAVDRDVRTLASTKIANLLATIQAGGQQ